jgi:hypothetical protein
MGRPATPATRLNSVGLGRRAAPARVAVGAAIALYFKIFQRFLSRTERCPRLVGQHFRFQGRIALPTSLLQAIVCARFGISRIEAWHRVTVMRRTKRERSVEPSPLCRRSHVWRQMRELPNAALKGIKAAPLRAPGAPVSGLCAGGARPARARSHRNAGTDRLGSFTARTVLRKEASGGDSGSRMGAAAWSRFGSWTVRCGRYTLSLSALEGAAGLAGRT